METDVLIRLEAVPSVQRGGSDDGVLNALMQCGEAFVTDFSAQQPEPSLSRMHWMLFLAGAGVFLYLRTFLLPTTPFAAIDERLAVRSHIEHSLSCCIRALNKMQPDGVRVANRQVRDVQKYQIRCGVYCGAESTYGDSPDCSRQEPFGSGG